MIIPWGIIIINIYLTLSFSALYEIVLDMYVLQFEIINLNISDEPYIEVRYSNVFFYSYTKRTVSFISW